MSVLTRYTLMHPCADQVRVMHNSPREIVLQLGKECDVELWPGADDHDEQVAWIDSLAEKLRIARQMMVGDHGAHTSGELL